MYVLIANNAESMIQKAGGHGLIPFFFRFGNFKKNHSCPHLQLKERLILMNHIFDAFSNNFYGLGAFSVTSQ